LKLKKFMRRDRNAAGMGNPGWGGTLIAITGSIAEAFYGSMPEEIAAEVWKRIRKNCRRLWGGLIQA
jgi:hypothetical protein